MARMGCCQHMCVAAALCLALASTLSAEPTIIAASTTLDLLPVGGGLQLSGATLLSLAANNVSIQQARLESSTAGSGSRAGPVIPPAASFGSARRYQKPYNICISDWTPLVECNGLVSPDDYTGYLVSMVRYIVDDLGWAEGDWFMHCMGPSDVVNDLADPDGSCLFVASGQDMATYNYEQGLLYSVPIYRSGLQAMVHAKMSVSNPWAFTNVFSWEVWLSLGLTAVGVGVLLWVLDRATLHQNRWDKTAEQHYERDLNAWQWYTLSRLMDVDNNTADPSFWAGKTLCLGYGFLVMIMLHIYTAASAVQLTQETSSNKITSITDLQGRSVITPFNYVVPLAKRSLYPTGAPWETEADLMAMVAKVKSGQYTAMVNDVLTMRYLVNSDPSCELLLLGEPFMPFQKGIAFAGDAAQGLIDLVDRAILHVQSDYTLMDLLDQLYTKTSSNPQCGKGLNTVDGGRNANAVSFGRVAGLWVILGASIGAAILMVVVQNLMYKEDPNKVAMSGKGSHVSSTLQSSLNQVSMGTAATAGTAGASEWGDADESVARLEQIEFHLQALEDHVAQATGKTPRSARGK